VVNMGNDAEIADILHRLQRYGNLANSATPSYRPFLVSLRYEI
jgi:hypothetical protein